jgi:hypothetical protein
MDRNCHHYKVDRKHKSKYESPKPDEPSEPIGIMYCDNLPPGFYSVGVRGGFGAFEPKTVFFKVTISEASSAPKEHHTILEDAVPLKL